jgi:hypothetical protein
MVLHQLRCCGVLEVARIARAGFPTRYTHQVGYTASDQHAAGELAACRPVQREISRSAEKGHVLCDNKQDLIWLPPAYCKP